MCASVGGALTCFTSANESAFVASLLSDGIGGASQWIGHYRSSYPEWSCGVANNFTNLYEAINPVGFECALLYSTGLWSGYTCEFPRRCMCEYGTSVPSEYAGLIGSLEALAHSGTGTMWMLTAIIAVLPSLTTLGLVVFRRIKKRSAQLRLALLSATGNDRLSTSQEHKDHCENLYSTAQAASWSMRIVVCGLVMCVGWALLAIGLIPFLMGGPALLVLGGQTATLPLTLFGGVLLGMGCHPKDIQSVRVIATSLFALMLALSVYLTMNALSNSLYIFYWLVQATGTLMTALCLAPAAGLRRLGRAHSANPEGVNYYSARWTLHHVWRCTRLWLVFAGVSELISVTTSLVLDTAYYTHPEFRIQLTYSLCAFLAVVLAAPGTRAAIHSLLAGLTSEFKDEVQKASMLASMIGNRSAGVAYQLGIKNFRGLPMSTLNAEHFRDSKDSNLYKATIACELGGVDAFISHSWRDEPDLKWAKLEAWLAESGKDDPLVWLDKACINQKRIDESLASLPVFLSGCEALIALCGKTYTQRLWCVMELFTFVQMGASPNRIRFLVLGGEVESRHSMGATMSTDLLQHFDASNADCYNPEDRERLLGVIESSFGDLHVFNRVVRSLFDAGRKSLTKSFTRYQSFKLPRTASIRWGATSVTTTTKV